MIPPSQAEIQVESTIYEAINKGIQHPEVNPLFILCILERAKFQLNHHLSMIQERNRAEGETK